VNQADAFNVRMMKVDNNKYEHTFNTAPNQPVRYYFTYSAKIADSLSASSGSAPAALACDSVLFQAVAQA
jgi:hypothetical protein